MVFKRLMSVCVCVLSIKVMASPWMDANDVHLRADLQLLNDTGVIDLPITTYPLMWSSIFSEIHAVELSTLSSLQQDALIHIQRKMNFFVKKGFIHRASLSIANKNSPFSDFGKDTSNKFDGGFSTQYTHQNFSGQLKINLQKNKYNIKNTDKIHFDDSYIAFKLGNWIVNAGAIDQWWGPGYDTSLILSSNARPLPAIAIRRNNSKAFDHPWLHWIGPWTLTSQIAQLEHERFIPEAKLWSTRFTLKPFQSLELGLSWSYQWGGKGEDESLDRFIDGLLGRSECANPSMSCDSSQHTKLGNQLAGFDLRWSHMLWNRPYALYAQSIGEDSAGKVNITDKASLYGIETQFQAYNQRILMNLEYTDTQVGCGGKYSSTLNCFYEHTTYKTGYRYHQKSIGSTYDNDSKTLALSVITRLVNQDSWQFKVKRIHLNTDNRDRYPNTPSLGHHISKVAENWIQMSFEYQLHTSLGEYQIGLIANHSKKPYLKQASESKIHYTTYLSYTLFFSL
jgi:hypothetical protein